MKRNYYLHFLDNLNQLDYPKVLYTVHVVADNCTDRTAELARQAGAMVHERVDPDNRGKGFALQWLLQRIWKSEQEFDAVIILDADSVVSRNFLVVMDAKLKQGHQIIQANDAVLDPDRSWAMSMRAAAMAAVNYLRPQGRMVLGGSVGLKGNGMVFHRSVLAQHEWSASVTEDIDYHMSLILAGKRVVFAPDASVWAEMPASLGGASWTQNVRWEQGRIQMAKYYVPKLLSAALWPNKDAGQASRYPLFDAAMEHLIPPFSILAGLTMALLLLAVLLGSSAAIAFAALLLFVQFIYMIAGMALAGLSKKTYLALLYVPAYMVWKIWLYLRVLFKFEQQGWIRTARDNA